MGTFLEGNIEEIIYDLGWGKDFLETKIMIHKTKYWSIKPFLKLSTALKKTLFKTMERQMTGSKY